MNEKASAPVKLPCASFDEIHQKRLGKKMAYVDAKSFSHSYETKAPSFLKVMNICPRTALLSELDTRMAARQDNNLVHNNLAHKNLTPQRAMNNCPEHLFSIDEDKLAVARLANG